MGPFNVDRKQKYFGISRDNYEVPDINKAFKESFELEADERLSKTTLTTYHEVIFNSELIDVLGFAKKNFFAGAHLGKKDYNYN